MRSGNVAELSPERQSALVSPHGRAPLEIAYAVGHRVFSTTGAEYIDLTSGWNVANIGWSHPHVLSRVGAQLGTLALSPAWCVHRPAVDLSEAISERLPAEYSLLRAPSGSQAIEFALRIARRATGRYAIVSVSECYHGSTLGSLAASGIHYLQREDPVLLDWHRALPVRYSDGLYERVAAVIEREPLPAAILVEPTFTNPGGINLGKTYYDAIFSCARSCGALVIMDEIGTAIGRLGKLFGFELWDCIPDMVVMGKSLGGGIMPIAGVAMQRDLAPAATGLAFDSTFAGTPAACEAALATLEVLEREDLLTAAGNKGRLAFELLQRLLGSHAAIREIRCTGLLLAIEFAGSQAEQRSFATSVVARLLTRRVFCEQSRYSHSLLIMPPAMIPEDIFLGVVATIAEVIDEVHCSNPTAERT